jgi:hypothetical protein
MTGALAAAVAACSSPEKAADSAPLAALAQSPAPATSAAAQASPAPQTMSPIVIGPADPHFVEADLPPLPDNLGYSPRPADYVRTVYKFAAHNADLLKFVPCFCGCERMGHHANDECFIARRGGNGQVLEWQPHGVICEVCLDVAHEAMQLHNTGASIEQIRRAIDTKWTTPNGSHTNTPMPPHAGGH